MVGGSPNTFAKAIFLDKSLCYAMSYKIAHHSALLIAHFFDMTKNIYYFFVILIGLSACRGVYLPNKVYTTDQLKKDFWVMKNGLEASHPSLYWYSSKDSVDLAFDNTLKRLDKPMTALEFRQVLELSAEPIRCGHTGVYGSVGFEKYRKKNLPHKVPLLFGYFDNKFHVLDNNSSDSTIKKGSELISINGHTAQAIYDTIFRFTNSDGHNQTYKKYVVQAYFDNYYRYWFGEKDAYSIVLRDSLGQGKTFLLKSKKEDKKKKPIAKTKPSTPLVPISKRLVGNDNINLRLWEKDSTIAILTQQSFGQKHYKTLYAKCFEVIKARNIQHLVIDVRSNGGGKASSTSKLLSYLLDSTFVVHSDVDALPWRPNRNFKNRFFTGMFLGIYAKKKQNGHLTLKAATKAIEPIKQNHYQGKLYVLTNGGSFSAASIFPAIVQAHQRGTIIGRETGGGVAGCTAWVIPYLTLPETKIRIRVPLFKLYNAVKVLNTGHGVIPEHLVNYQWSDVLQNRDLDFEKVQMLKNKK